MRADYTVDVVDKTGRAIHSSRTIVSALKEARSVYRAKRAQKAAQKERQLDAYYEEQARRLRHEARRQREIETGETEAERHARHQARRERRRAEREERRERRGSSDSASDHGSEKSVRYGYTHSNTSALTFASGTDNMSVLDMVMPQPSIKDDHLTALLLQVSDILDHMSAFQSSIFALIEALRRDPEQLAMVGLTLAEISAIVTKLSPSVLMGLKSAWPMVFAFLSSPQFAIVAGVGVGTTVVLLGGYRIIKRLGLIGGGNEEEETTVKQIDQAPESDLDLGGRVEEMDMRSLQRMLPAIEEQPALPIESLPSLIEQRKEVPLLAFDVPKIRSSKSRSSKTSRSGHESSSSSRKRDGERERDREGRRDRERERERRSERDVERVSTRSSRR